MDISPLSDDQINQGSLCSCLLTKICPPLLSSPQPEVCPISGLFGLTALGPFVILIMFFLKVRIVCHLQELDWVAPVETDPPRCNSTPLQNPHIFQTSL